MLTFPLCTFIKVPDKGSWGLRWHFSYCTVLASTMDSSKRKTLWVFGIFESAFSSKGSFYFVGRRQKGALERSEWAMCGGWDDLKAKRRQRRIGIHWNSRWMKGLLCVHSIKKDPISKMQWYSKVPMNKTKLEVEAFQVRSIKVSGTRLK